jgi:hypothetical protein
MKTKKIWIGAVAGVAFAGSALMGLDLGEKAGAAEGTAITIAAPANLAISAETDLLVFTGQIENYKEFNTSCMQDLGFTSTHTGRKMVVIDTAVPPAATVDSYAYATGDVGPGTRVKNLTLVGFCSDSGMSYKVYEGVAQ